MAEPAVERFQQWLEGTFANDPRFERTQPVAANFEAGLRLEAGTMSCYEVTARLAERVVRVGFLTTDRSLNETIEQGILDSGDSLDELMELELDERGEEPMAMEHYFDRPAFCYTTNLAITAPESLDLEPLRRRVRVIVDCCYALFQPYLTG